MKSSFSGDPHELVAALREIMAKYRSVLRAIDTPVPSDEALDEVVSRAMRQAAAYETLEWILALFRAARILPLPLDRMRRNLYDEEHLRSPEELISMLDAIDATIGGHAEACPRSLLSTVAEEVLRRLDGGAPIMVLDAGPLDEEEVRSPDP